MTDEEHQAIREAMTRACNNACRAIEEFMATMLRAAEAWARENQTKGAQHENGERQGKGTES